jgi:transcription initiation factor TFIIH subunit 4
MASARARASGRAQNPLNQTILSDFMTWAAISPEKIDALYNSPHATQCVLRALPPVARLYVARVLYLPDAAPAFAPALFRDALCRRTRARDRHEAALSTLRALRVFVPVHDGDEAAAAATLLLNRALGRQLRRSVTGAMPLVFGGPVGEFAEREIAMLDLFSADRLERVLNFSIGGEAEDMGRAAEDMGRAAAPLPSQTLQNALSRTKILAPCENGRYMQITSIGFQFLLKDSCSQIWILLRDVINGSFAGAELEALNFIFQLSFARAGCPYATRELKDTQRSLAPCLDELGVIVFDDGNDVFFPTPLGIGLVASASRSLEDSGGSARQVVSTSKTAGDIEIIVETNFRLYAYVYCRSYTMIGNVSFLIVRCKPNSFIFLFFLLPRYTTSAFQMNLLSLFTHMRYQLPNLVVGHLTREKVREALVNGISADQIINFLNSHAHPRMKGGAVPHTVRDEIKLWEAEQERVQFLPGFLISDFESPEQFQLVLAYANDHSACLWYSVAQRQLVVVKDEYARLRNYIKNQ